MTNEIANVCSYLSTKAILIPTSNEWLTSCVECFKSQGLTNLKDLKELVFQQWLLADLNDIGVPSFPPNCLTADKIILTGSYSVQLNYVVNIAASFHKQLTIIRRPEVHNNLEVDCENQQTQLNKCEKNTNNRILKMEITDGVITVFGFEDQFIPLLQEPIVPGKKAILRGPIECRRGILFLRPCNISILGGEVDTLHIQNATENILARALKLPENPDPYKQHIIKDEVGNKSDYLEEDNEELMMVAAAIENETPINNSINRVEPNRLVNSHISTCDDNKYSLSRNNQTFRPLKSNASEYENINNYIFDDDFDVIAVQGEIVETNKHTNNSHLTNVDSNGVASLEMFDPIANQKCVEDMKKLKRELEESYGNFKWVSKVNLDLPRPIKEEGKILVDYLKDSESVLFTVNDIEENPVSQKVKLEEENQIENLTFPPKEFPSVIKVKAKIVKILQKPKLKGDKWSVSALVEAKGIQLETSFSSEVVDKVFTVSAAELLTKREQLKYDTEMKERMNDSLKESQQRFSKLNCDMTFSFNDRISKPIVIDLYI